MTAPKKKRPRLKKVRKAWMIRFGGTEIKSRKVEEALRFVMGALTAYACFDGVDFLKMDEVAQ